MISFKKSLAGKIFIGFILLVIILLVITFWSIRNFNQLSTSIDNIMEENYRSIQATENMIESIERQDSAVLMLLGGQEDTAVESFRSQEQEFFKWFARAEDNITIEEENEIISRLNDLYMQYLDKIDQLRAMDIVERQEFYNTEYFETFQQSKETIRELRSVNQETMVAAQQQANARAGQARYSTILISALGIIMAAISSYILSRRILSPINQLKEGINRVAARNFNQKLPVNSRDEIGELTEEFNKMIDKLQEYENLNVRKLKAEKEKSEAIVNHISSPLLVTDDENRLILYNQDSQDLFDLRPEDLDNHILEIINNQELFDLITREPEYKNEEEAPVLELAESDERRYYRIVSNQVKTDEDEKQFTVTLLEDITRLKEIDRMKSNFISTVSHEFRTPLTSITMALSMLAAEDVGELNEEQRELVESSKEDCERLTNLVEDLLDLSRMESNEIKLDLRDVNLRTLTEKTMEQFTQQAEDKGVELYKDNIPSELNVEVDPNKISWVLSNLIGNSLRYTGSGDKIRLSARQHGAMTYIEVYDTGKGIKQENLKRIFDKFFRSEENISDSGSGLGLAIAKEIVQAHQGRIWAESEKGSWTKFTFSIPASSERNRERKDGNDEKNSAD